MDCSKQALLPSFGSLGRGGGAIVLLFSLREVTYSSTGMSVVGENKALAWWASR